MNGEEPDPSRNRPRRERQAEGAKGPEEIHSVEPQGTSAKGEVKGSIHLGLLTIRRFRSCEEVEVAFQPDLTVLVGENNGGKSNIIDALRLLTLPLNGRRERYPEDEDLRRGSSTANFEIVGEYRGLSDTLKGLLISAVPDPTKDEAVFGYRYEVRSDIAPRGRTMLWVGKFDTAEPEPGSTDLIRHVYLPALRDAHQALGSGSGARIMALFRQFLPKEQEAEFLKEVKRRERVPDVLSTLNSQIGTALGALTSGVRAQHAKIDFAMESLLDVARSLRFKLADAGLSPEEIRASGLGYSNLLYMATVVVELAKAKESDLTLFLVEEPEAHLHPQLQMLVLEFLLEHARNSSTSTPVSGKPEGRIQVVVSTHSPNLTAWVAPKHLVVVRSQSVQRTTSPTAEVVSPGCGDCPGSGGEEVELGRSEALHPESVTLASEDEQVQREPVSHTVVVPIAELGISPKTLGKIGRYLDVTRSSLLFGNRALLVEGMAESLLLPVIAREYVLRSDREALLRFKGTVIVPIEGVDFLPYIEVLLRASNGARVADRVVVITDRDPSVEGNRKEQLEKLAEDLGAPSAIHVYVCQHTLEHELMLVGNEAVLKKAFLEVHPRSGEDWRTRIEDADETQKAEALLSLFADKRTRKGDFAQHIASLIEAGDAFNVPPYLRDAIRKIAEP